jgi:hypothetical protein
MSWGKLATVGLLTLALLGLLGWQMHREHLVKACLSTGGAWDGDTCGPPRLRPILRRDLERS